MNFKILFNIIGGEYNFSLRFANKTQSVSAMSW